MEAAKITGAKVSITGMLKYLNVSRSGFHAFLKRKPSYTEKHRAEIKTKILQIYNKSFQNYGAPKITQELKKQNIRISQRTVSSYMQQMGIHAQWVKPWIATTLDSDFSSTLHNILNERFNPPTPNSVWCTDITYIWTALDGFVYLTSIMDLYSRKIIAWTLSRKMDVSCVIDTVKKAKSQRELDHPLIIHSNRGSQYVSSAYRDVTQNPQRSYSHKGYPYDNACIESFHSLIKREWLNRVSIQDYYQAYSLVFEYIETFYNTVRIHSHCDYMSPDDFEEQYSNLQKPAKQAI